MKVVVLNVPKNEWYLDDIPETQINFLTKEKLWVDCPLFLGADKDTWCLQYWDIQIVNHPNTFDHPPYKGCGHADEIGRTFKKFAVYAMGDISHNTVNTVIGL